MSYSISLNNFKKVAAVATFLLTATCLVPESVQARALVRGSGESNCDKIAFTLNTSVMGIPGDKADTFLFPKAVIASDFIYHEDQNNCENTEGISFFNFNAGNLTVSKVEESDQNLLDELFDRRQNPVIVNEDIEQLKDNLLKNGVKYKGTLLGINSSSNQPASLELNFFIPSFEPSSDLSKFAEQLPKSFLLYSVESSDLKLTQRVNSCLTLNGDFLDNRCFKVSATEIPESSTTGSLLGLGALGAMLLVKRSKYLR